AVIDEEARADGRTGMDVDIAEEAAKPRQEPRRKAPARDPEAVCEAIPDNGMDAGIGQQRLQLAARRWIAQADAGDILPDPRQQRGFARLGVRSLDRIDGYDAGHIALRPSWRVDAGRRRARSPSRSRAPPAPCSRPHAFGHATGCPSPRRR